MTLTYIFFRNLIRKNSSKAVRCRAGRYNVAFDAAHLASGMYVCRIEAGKYSAVRRMLLMKQAWPN